MRFHNGIAVGPILFVVAILAVLVAAINSGSGGLGSNTSPERAKSLAIAIVQQFQNQKNAFNKIESIGCSDTEISFENPIVTGYTNSSAPTDKRCHVLDLAGGGISYIHPPRDAFDWSFSSIDCCRGEYHFQARWADGKNTSATTIGRPDWCGGACADFLVTTPYVTKAVCKAVNDLAGVINPSDAPPPALYAVAYAGGGFKWVGNNPAGSKWTINSVEDRPIYLGCFEGLGTRVGSYYAFMILGPR